MSLVDEVAERATLLALELIAKELTGTLRDRARARMRELIDSEVMMMRAEAQAELDARRGQSHD